MSVKNVVLNHTCSNLLRPKCPLVNKIKRIKLYPKRTDPQHNLKTTQTHVIERKTNTMRLFTRPTTDQLHVFRHLEHYMSSNQTHLRVKHPFAVSNGFARRSSCLQIFCGSNSCDKSAVCYKRHHQMSPSGLCLRTALNR